MQPRPPTQAKLRSFVSDRALYSSISLDHLHLACTIPPLKTGKPCNTKARPQLENTLKTVDLNLSDEVLTDIQAVYRERPMPI